MSAPLPSDQPRLRFGAFASGYEAGRPNYPEDAVAWLAEGAAGPLVELGAGTGKLTRSLARYSAAVIAVEPDPAMSAVLRVCAPAAIAVRASAEELPLRDHSVGTLIAAQAWHWFDADRAWASAMRVLKPDGRLSVAWNAPLPRTQWHEQLQALAPAISPVTEDWWPASIPKEGMESRLFHWDDYLTSDQVSAEYATHLSIRKVDVLRRTELLASVKALADEEAARRGDGVVPFGRLTWCARTAN